MGNINPNPKFISTPGKSSGGPPSRYQGRSFPGHRMMDQVMAEETEVDRAVARATHNTLPHNRCDDCRETTNGSHSGWDFVKCSECGWRGR